MLNKIALTIRSKRKLSLHVIVFFILILTPLLFWGNTLYRLGGDDSLFYYLRPWEMLDKYVFNLYTKNNPGSLGVFGTQSYQVPFLYLISILKRFLPYVNTQSLFYGLNLSIGYIGFIALLREIKVGKLKIELEIVSGLSYVFSNFSIYTLWGHQLFPLYLISVFPFCLFLFSRGVRRNSTVHIIVLALLLSVFSILSMSVPWTLGTIICFLPFFLVLASKNILRFLKHLVIFTVIYSVINAYWMYPLAQSFFIGGTGSTDILNTSVTNTKANNAVDTIISVTSGNSVLSPILNQFHISTQRNNSWTSYSVFLKWGLYLYPLMVVYPLLYVTKLIFDRPKKLDYYVIFFVWVVSIYFFTVKVFGQTGLEFFIWLNNSIPGFNMFKNMFDKFGYAMAISTSLLIAFSIDVCCRIQDKNKYNFVVGLLLALQIITATPFILDWYHKFPISGTLTSYSNIVDLNNDYYEMVNYFKNSEDESKILWLPLNIANYTPIRGKDATNNYYFGVSPLTFLANKNDIAGFIGLGPYSEEMETAIINGNTERVLSVLSMLNINYVIVNKDVSSELNNSYLYPGGIYQKQMNPEFLKQILGKKVAEFGNKYSVYSINEKYLSRRIELRKTLEDVDRGVKIDEVTDDKFKVSFEVLEDEQLLILRETNNAGWKILSDRGRDLNISQSSSQKYGNQWVISDKICEVGNCYFVGEKKFVTVYLYFQPASGVKTARTISLIAVFCVIIYMSIRLTKAILEKKYR